MRKLLSAMALAALFLIGGASAALASQATDIVVDDTAGTLDLGTLIPAIEKLNFNEPTKVAIFTRDGKYSDDLNEEVLRHARDKHPEWLSGDGQKWADSLFVFALDRSGRQVGTYFGEDRKVTGAQRDDIQNATKDLYREAQWTEGTIAAVERAAQLMNRPWYKSPAPYAWTGAVVVVGGVSIGSNLYVRRLYRRRSKTALDEGNSSYANVSMDLDVTELNAKTINNDSRFGSLVLERYRGFSAAYNDLAELANKANGMDPNCHGRKETAKFMKDYAKKATELDRLDDVISDTNMLLNMGSGWADSWERQLAPLREDLAAIDSLLDDPDAAADAPSALALRRLEAMKATDMEGWGAALQSRQLSPEDGIDKIDAAREELTGLLRDYSEAVIDKYAKTSKEAELMRTAMRTTTPTGTGHSSKRSILGTVYPSNRFWSVIGFSSGFHSGQSSVQESRSPSTSSGGHTGYGSSGGSFSGSGSSSRF